MKTASRTFKSQVEEHFLRSHLSKEQRVYCWLSASVALMADGPMRFFVELALENSISILCIKEVILQNYLFCGFPNAIEGLIILKEIADASSLHDANYHERRDEQAMIKDGEKLCAVIYGKNFFKLMDNMKSMSLDLHHWMIREGYGKVLSRPVLDPLERELCTIASLAVLSRERQLISHAKGALHVGADKEQLFEVIHSVGLLVGKKVGTRARTLLHKIL
jgi:4-carboxymuconolactone decarboxylase